MNSFHCGSDPACCWSCGDNQKSEMPQKDLGVCKSFMHCIRTIFGTLSGEESESEYWKQFHITRSTVPHGSSNDINLFSQLPIRVFTETFHATRLFGVNWHE